jgi:hypothetical protein
MPVQKSLSEVEPHDTANTRRQVEVTRDDLKRRWPHHMAVPAEKVRDPVNGDVIFCAQLQADERVGQVEAVAIASQFYGQTRKGTTRPKALERVRETASQANELQTAALDFRSSRRLGLKPN